MIHLFKHSKGKLKGKFDIALVVKGRVIVFSNQGYSRHSDGIKAIKSLLKSLGKDYCHFQDDTGDISEIFYLEDTLMYKEDSMKPHKPYIPR